jgi:preprotein translocase subunit SecB
MSEINFKALHAIQLVSVETRELFIRLNGQISEDLDSFYKEHLEIRSAHSEFNSEENIIHVGLRLSLGMDKDVALPISMRVEITGTFTVNIDDFSVKHIDDWATKNAPYILYPFVREHSFALAIRCGLPPMILPMVQVPTITSHAKS